jgi:hypothetical protein
MTMVICQAEALCSNIWQGYLKSRIPVNKKNRKLLNLWTRIVLMVMFILYFAPFCICTRSLLITSISDVYKQKCQLWCSTNWVGLCVHMLYTELIYKCIAFNYKVFVVLRPSKCWEESLFTRFSQVICMICSLLGNICHLNPSIIWDIFLS